VSKRNVEMWLRKIRIENGFPKRKGGKKGEQGEDPAVESWYAQGVGDEP